MTRKNIKSDGQLSVVVLGFFLLMLLLPSQYQIARGVVLALIFIGSVAKFALGKGSWHLQEDVKLYGFICLVMALLYLAYGWIIGNHGALRAMTVYFAWPLLFLWFSGFIVKLEKIYSLVKTLLIGTLIIGSLVIVGVVDFYTGRHLSEVFAFIGIRLGLDGGSVKVSSLSTPVLFFSIPFMVTVLFVSKSMIVEYLPRIWKTILSVALVLALLNILVTGRSALWVIGALAIPIAVFSTKITGLKVDFGKYVQIFSVVVIVIGLTSILTIGFEGGGTFEHHYQRVIEKVVDFSNPDSRGHRRYVQAVIMMDGFRQSPIFGHGIGAGVSDISEDFQGGVELSYLALVYQFGFFGLSIYLMAVIRVISLLCRFGRVSLLFARINAPIIAGMLGFLIANATNPLLEKFDFMWVIFLPIAVINTEHYYIAKRRHLRAHGKDGLRNRNMLPKPAVVKL